MASRGRSPIERPGGINERENSESHCALILSVVKEASQAPIVELKNAASLALVIFKTTLFVKENKEAYKELGYDSGRLIIAIWRSFKKAEDPEKWLSVEMRHILEDLSHTLENICSFVNKQLSKRKAIRVIFGRSESLKINEYREHLKYAKHKFELQSHMNIYDEIIQVLKKNNEISEQLLHRHKEEEKDHKIKHTLKFKACEAPSRDRERAEKLQDEEWEMSKLEQLRQVEIDRQSEDELWQSEELKKIEKATKDRKSQLERLRAAARELEEGTSLMKAEEGEIAQLKRALAAKEDNRGSIKTRARSSKKRSSRQEDKVYQEEHSDEWEGYFVVEESSSEEELDLPVRRSSTAERNALGSPRTRLVPVDSTDDEDNRGSMKTRARSSKKRSSRQEDKVYQEEHSDEWEGNFVVEESSSEEELELPVRRSSTAKRNASGSPRTRLVPVVSSDDEEYLQSLWSSRLRTFRRKLSSASLPKEVFKARRNARMARRNLSSASLRDTEDDYSTDEEDYYTRLPPRKSFKRPKRKPQTSLGNLDDFMPRFQGFMPMGMGMGSPHRSGSNSLSGSPIYIVGSEISSNAYSNVGNDNSVRKVYCPRCQRAAGN